MRKITVLFFSIFAFTCGVWAQDYRFDKDLLTKEFHKSRREALRKIMDDSSVAVIFANPVRNRANDVDFQYHQDPDFYYLCGIPEPHAVLLIFKEKQTIAGVTAVEFIFVQDRNPLAETWTGMRLGTTGAMKVYGFDTAFVNKKFGDFPVDFSSFKTIYHSRLYNDVRDDTRDKGDLFNLIRTFRQKTESLEKKKDPENFDRMMASLREVKLEEELKLLRKAVDISCVAHAELMRALEPGMTEFQAQAIVEYFFKKQGSEYTGYPSIVGGGANACVLHYVTNRKQLNGQEMLLIDAGAEYHGYTADITRTLPTDGKFSPEEKAIYELVLKAQMEGIKACLNGKDFWDPHKAAQDVISQGLLDLGIIKDKKDVGRYFNHGTSHYLGLDVHDAGLYGNLKPGSVITVEPGIYIKEGSPCDPKWWNIGVRIEDDVLITENEPEVLSGHLPRTVEEIEKLMQERSFLNPTEKK